MNVLLRLRNNFQGIQLKYKLLLSYVVFFFLPLCFFSLITFQSVSVIIENNVIYSVEKNYNQTFSYLSDKFNKVKKTSDIILTNDDVNSIFITNNLYSSMENYFTMKRAMDFLGSFEDEDISRIVLFLYEDENFKLSSYFDSIKDVEKSKWYNTINTSNLNLLWCPSSFLNNMPKGVKQSSYSYALIRRFYNPMNYSVTLGYYCLYFKPQPIESIVNMGDAVSGSVTYLENSSGELIYASNRGQFDRMHSLFERRTQDKESTSLLKTCIVDGEKLVYTKKELPYSDWSLITVISYKDVLSQVTRTQETIALFTGLISVICFTFAWMMARSMTKRIILLQNKMKQVQRGNFNLERNNPYTDEIGYLTNTYDFMIDKIRELMEDRYKAGIQVKAAELKALQEQINPHFLYNTLDTINWLAQKGSTAEVEKAISALAEFYRLSLSSGNDEIPIHDELKRISTYVDIQNIRFSGGIRLIMDIDEEIGSFPILKLLLQPFVENSILHGILNKPSKEGYILIEAMIDGENIKITIQDNGIGMSEEQLEKANEEYRGGSHIGFGIKNVRERVMLNYGDQYNIRFTSCPGAGTTAEITIPAKYK